MRFIGFNFSKISIEKSKDNLENLKISNKINISEIKKVKSDFFKTKEEILEAKFSYEIIYEPQIANLSFEGSVLLSIDSKESKEILKKWETKEISENFKIILFNIILKKSNLKALQLEYEMNLPTHITLPFLKGQKKEEK